MAAGIAKPGSLLRSLGREGVEIVGVGLYPDHYRFQPSDLQRIRQEADRLGATAILTTEKDAVRIAPILGDLKHWWAVRMELSLENRKAFSDLIMEKLNL